MSKKIFGGILHDGEVLTVMGTQGEPIGKYVVLKEGASLSSQMTMENTRYIVKSDFDLGGGSVSAPSNCVLSFDGGVISNGTLVGDDTVLSAEAKKIFDTNVTLSGTWNITESHPEWFGAVPDGETDCSAAINKLLGIKGFTTIKFGKGTYLCNLVINNSVY